MASIVVDGPRDWALDVLDRKLGRALSGVAGMVLLLAVFVIQPGPARLACVIGAVILLSRAARHPSIVTADDLAEVELLIMRLREQHEAHVDAARADVVEQIDGIIDIVSDIRSQVR